MNNIANNDFPKKSKIVSWIASICVGIIGFLVLVGWYFDIEVLKRISPSFIAMKPNAAISFIMISLSLIFHLYRADNKKPIINFLEKTCIFITFVICFLTSIENITHYDFHIDQLIFQEQPNPTVFYSPGRMAPITSITLLTISIVLFLQNIKRLTLLFQCLAILSGLVGIAIIAGLAFHVALKTEFVHYAYASFHSAINFILIVIAFLFLKPSQGIMRIITSNTAGGQAARRLIIFIIITPIISVYLTFYGENNNIFDQASGHIFLTVFNIAVLLSVLFWISYKLMRTDIVRRKVFSELQKANEELKYSNNELQQIIRVATHDLQEPLRMISSFTQLLASRYKDKLDSDANDFINFAVDGAQRMQKQLNDMLAYTHVMFEKKEFQLTDCNILLQHALIELKEPISETKAEITVAALPTLSVNPSQIQMVFKNLIDNAIKFCQQQPKINIAVQDAPTEFIFSIQDNGIGIAPEYHDQIFILFKRLHRRDQYLGTGIGLPICKKIIEFHHGKIWLKSEEGKGSTFYFSIPK